MADLMEEYRAEHDEVAVARVDAVDEPRRVALPGGDLVYSSVEFSGVGAVFGPVAAISSPALSLGGTAGELTVVADPPSGLVVGRRAVLVPGRTPGVGETLANAYLITGGSVILDGLCQKPGDLRATPASAAVDRMIGATQTSVAGTDDTAPVAVDLQAFLAVARG